MDAITCSSARTNPASTMNRVCEDHEALTPTGNREQFGVMVSLEYRQSLGITA